MRRKGEGEMDRQAGPQNRDLIIEGIVARTGIDEAMIERLVRAFDDRASLDPLIGPVFESKVQDWDRHLSQMCAFWSSVALMSGRYHGQPMVVHLPLPVEMAHFNRWLEIFARRPGVSVRRRQRFILSSALIGLPIAWSLPSHPREGTSGRSNRGRRLPFCRSTTGRPDENPEAPRRLGDRLTDQYDLPGPDIVSPACSTA
jgi:hypothetical protein